MLFIFLRSFLWRSEKRAPSIPVLLKSPKLKRIVAISNELRKQIAPKAPEKEIIVAHDGAVIPESNCDIEIKVKYFSKYDKQIKIGYVGHLYPGKGAEIILKIAERISINFEK